MNETIVLRGLAICLIFSPAVAAAESSAAPASALVARAAKPGCAKLVCQSRAFAADSVVSAEPPAAESNASGVSVLVGLGAGAFHGPAVEMGFVDLVQESGPGAVAVAPGSTPIEIEGWSINDERRGRRRVKVEGPAVSLGVSLAQPLIAAAALRLGLEERFTLAAVLPLSGGSSFAGVGDILLTARQASWPLQIAAGPSLAIAQVDTPGEEVVFFEPAVVAGGAALLRLDLAHALPGAIDLVGHYGKGLNYEGSSYRDLQLAFALRL